MKEKFCSEVLHLYPTDLKQADLRQSAFCCRFFYYEREKGSAQRRCFDLTEKEMRKMNRYQLLEMLIFQTERADQLETAARKIGRASCRERV